MSCITIKEKASVVRKNGFHNTGFVEDTTRASLLRIYIEKRMYGYDAQPK